MSKLRELLGRAQVRQVLLDATNRLLFRPAVFTVVGAIAAMVLVAVDRTVVDGDHLPRVLQTSVDSSRVVLGTIATGLIAAYTLMLSLLLVAVQLASTQLSPRTLRNFLGDRTLQRAIGLVLGTIVFCLLVLYRTQDFGEGDSFEPNVSVVVAILLAFGSLVGVLRGVDHIADSMRVGAISQALMAETLGLIHRIEDDEPIDRPDLAPIVQPGLDGRPPPGALVVESRKAGWIQRIEVHDLLRDCPDGASIHVPVTAGSFVMSSAPLAWVTPGPGDEEERQRLRRELQEAFAIGDSRTMVQDLGFGILRLVDIALRALSPSLNDENTAKDVIAHLGQVVLAVFAEEERAGVHREGDREVRVAALSHEAYLFAAFDQIRTAAPEHPQVSAVLLRTLLSIRDEVDRRSLPAHREPIDDLVVEILQDVLECDTLSRRERERVLASAPAALRRRAGDASDHVSRSARS